jgi:hypothetical protein
MMVTVPQRAILGVAQRADFGVALRATLGAALRAFVAALFASSLASPLRCNRDGKPTGVPPAIPAYHHASTSPNRKMSKP